MKKVKAQLLVVLLLYVCSSLPFLGFFAGEASVEEAVSAEIAVSSDLASSCFVDHILSSSACILGVNVALSFQILSNLLMLLTVLLSMVCEDGVGFGNVIMLFGEKNEHVTDS